ncbi:hypothetical protein N7478_012990 [Penicillium angulare]|uniref:uncharacterized protein n=1 Tax=Penicillium angulare TaxID=116970 RepID=UPI002540205F|nr:uncharacterized protein N7478_012990 [Penicillium angulare]KAJ5256886.1 hypothetical protein N7478_012990 [Penicillium angulare]
MIYGSNMIEEAGAGFDVNFKLCMKILQGEYVPGDIDDSEQDKDYTIIKQERMRSKLSANTAAVYKVAVDAESTPWEEYSGSYRSVDVSVDFHTFPNASLVPSKMKDMIKQLEFDFSQAVVSGLHSIMPAAKYTHIFVNIPSSTESSFLPSDLELDAVEIWGLHSGASTLEDTFDGREEEEKPVMHKEIYQMLRVRW